MKKIKIIHSAVIAAVLIFYLCVPAFAVSAPIMEIGKYTAEAGKTVDVTVSIKNNPGITYLRVTPVIDSETVTLKAVKNGNLFTTLDTGTNLVFSADCEVKANGELCVITFEVAEDAELNSVINVALTVRECYNDRYEDVNLTAENGLISVGCIHAETTDTVTKEPSCTQAGEKSCICNACGYETTAELPAVGHTEGEWETTKAPAVGVDGEMVIKCTVCGSTVKTQVIPALSGENSSEGGELTPPASSGCGGGGASAAITVFFTSTLPALALTLIKKGG